MLCDVIEGGEAKCMEYYPTAVGKDRETHKVQHYKWTDWPDRSAPANASPVVELMRKTKPMFVLGPVVVHCSAGIGRTGTYCALDYVVDRLAIGGALSIIEVVTEIRRQRLHSVQNALQYLCLHNCLVEYLIVTKVMQRDASARKFQREYEKYVKKFNERNAKTSSVN
ncbi:Receptor-type tyrosine-protein phosphatase C [Toxocara canis]|uniref:Receptor-type tyrosine-protein phosphatase C n=1 Tax=Toxocara canis TaxID=6265 RepID=A0A0B2VKM6_TOXCA|nr:Receptor-type tyrosine-protein phosphatase C [Toxocara canis]